MPDSALLIMDVQPGIIDRLADQKDAFIAKVQSVIDAAHSHGIQVIFVVVGFRTDFPEISPRNKSFQTVKNTHADHLVNSRPAITPTGNDLLVTKKRISAFAGSDLEVILRGKDIHHLILSGISTSGVVLSTLREAADKDYGLTVLSDLCFDPDEEVHRVLFEKIFSRQATVTTLEQWKESLGN